MKMQANKRGALLPYQSEREYFLSIPIEASVLGNLFLMSSEWTVGKHNGLVQPYNYAPIYLLWISSVVATETWWSMLE